MMFLTNNRNLKITVNSPKRGPIPGSGSPIEEITPLCIYHPICGVEKQNLYIYIYDGKSKVATRPQFMD